MTTNTPLVYTLDPSIRDALAHRLSDLGMEVEEAPHILIRSKGPDGCVTFYASGKLVIQGKRAEHLVAALAPLLPSANPVIGPGARELGARIGTDESGKGDYFGPLVVAAAYVDSGIESRLLDLGVKDSKKISDPVILKIEGEIRELCPHSIVMIGPSRYNELYQKISNLNRMLAWGHARVLENILQKVECSKALTDQFGDLF